MASISTSLAGFTISTDPNQAFQHGVWYATLFQDLGYLPTVPQAGTQALYHVFNSTATGNLSLGDNFFSTSADEISGLLGTPNISSGAVPGVALGKATIDGTLLSVLQWPAPEAGSRVTVTASPPLLYYGSTPTVFSPGDAHNTQLTQGAGQCVVLQFLQPGASHSLSIVIEHPAGKGYGAYQTRTDITVSAPATGVGDPVRHDTTADFRYVPQTRVFRGAGNTTVTDRPEVSRTVDRWGNVTQIDNPRGLGYNPALHTSYAYNANNQLIRQTQQLDEAADGADVANGAGRFEATTKLYYDALGRQVGIQDANGHVNVKTFDAAGNLVQERHADGGVTDITYDAFGDKLTSRVKMTVDSRIVGTDYTYDRLSRLMTTSLALRGTAYQAQFQSTHTVTLGPDINYVPGQITPTNTTNAANGATLHDDVQHTLQANTYDEAGRKTSVTNGAGEVTRYVYDLAGNVILSGQLDSSGLGLRYTTRTSFDALNHKTAQTDGNNNTQTWTYSQQGRLVGHTDFALNLLAAGASQTSSSSSHLVHYSYNYDNAGQLTDVHNDAALAQNIDYTYDTAGQLTQITGESLGQTTRYTYDLTDNRLSEQVWQKTLLPGAAFESNRRFFQLLRK